MKLKFRLIRKINKKSHNILKDFLENKVEKNILSERIDKYFNNINSDDVLSVIKGLRNKIAHGGITASISLNDEKGNKKRGEISFKDSIKLYNGISEFQIEIMDNWFIKIILPNI